MKQKLFIKIKSTIHTLITISILILFLSCKREEIGSVHGLIADKTQNEPLKGAVITLIPGGNTIGTGSDGFYSFNELKAGTYRIGVSKKGYKDTLETIIIKNDVNLQKDIYLEKMPPALRIVDDSGKSIDTIDFGGEIDQLTHSFNIFNDGENKLEWEITTTASWVDKISKQSGTLESLSTQSIVLTINRDELRGGYNVTTLHITSNDGSKQIIIMAWSEDKEPPTLNTLEATNIRLSTAVLNGKISFIGSPAYDERGFVYTISPMPTTENTITKVTVPVTSEKTYSHPISNLELGKTYYVRAYAKNSLGYAYSSNEILVKPTMIPPTVVTNDAEQIDIAAGKVLVSGSIEEEGEPVYSERGFVYGKNHNPTLDNDMQKIVSGMGTGTFSTYLTDIEEGNLYYVRAYATNKMGTVYGREKEINFIATPPEVKTLTVSNINRTSNEATLKGEVIEIGDFGYEKKGFAYGLSHMPNIQDNKIIEVSGNEAGPFSAKINDIQLGNIYYVRAYVLHRKGVSYGEEINLDFNPILPEVETKTVSNITHNSAMLNASVTNLGDPVYTERGFIYGTMQVPTIGYDGVSLIPISGTSEGKYSTIAKNLSDKTKYYVRAYVKTKESYIYGSVETFITEKQACLAINNLLIQPIDLGEFNRYKAITECSNSSACDYHKDWRLPSLEELKIIYANKDRIEGLVSDGVYWSSNFSQRTVLVTDPSCPRCPPKRVTITEYFAFDMSNGTSIKCGQTVTHRVRAVRTID